jgi:hypothetical protein
VNFSYIPKFEILGCDMVIPLMIASVTTAPVPSVAGGIGLTIRSSAEAWESSQRLTEYLEGLRNAEADRKGSHVSFYYSNPQFLLVDL